MNTGLPDFGAWFYYIWGAKMAWFWQNYATAWRSALICFTSVMQKASWEQKCLNATPCFMPHSWHASYPILTMLSYPKSGMVHAPFIPCFLPWIWHKFLTIISRYSWSRFETIPAWILEYIFGMDLGHDTGMDLAWIHGLDSRQSCMDFGGIVRGGFWHGFDGNFGMILGKILG